MPAHFQRGQWVEGSVRSLVEVDGAKKVLSSLTEGVDGVKGVPAHLKRGGWDERSASSFTEGVGGLKGVPAHLQKGWVG